MKFGTGMRWVAGVGLAAVASAAWAWQAGMPLIIDGKLASTGVKVINGRPYVPVADVAKAMNMVVMKKGAGYEIAPAGGAGQVEGARQGKIGDELFTGRWRFQVMGVRQADDYTERYYQEQKKIVPKGKGDTLILIDCRIKNGLKKSQTPALTEREPGNTALADDQGQSYPPIDYDARQESSKIGSYAAVALLPGAKADFTLVFSVPKGTKPKALVFSLLAYPDDIGRKKTTDVRVDLTR